MPIALTRRINDLAEGLTSITAELERQKTAIGLALEALRDVESVERAVELPAPAITEPATRKSAGRNRHSLAQKKRWALKRAASAVKKTARKQGAAKKAA